MRQQQMITPPQQLYVFQPLRRPNIVNRTNMHNNTQNVTMTQPPYKMLNKSVVRTSRKENSFIVDKINFEDKGSQQSEEKVLLKIEVVMPQKENNFEIVEKNVNVEQRLFNLMNVVKENIMNRNMNLDSDVTIDFYYFNQPLRPESQLSQLQEQFKQIKLQAFVNQSQH